MGRRKKAIEKRKTPADNQTIYLVKKPPPCRMDDPLNHMIARIYGRVIAGDLRREE